MQMKRRPFHPVLFAIYPVVFLMAYNVRRFALAEAFFPVLLSVGATAVIWVVAWRVTGNGKKAAVLASFLTILFWSYGHVFEAQGGIRGICLTVAGVKLGPNKILFAAWGVLLLAGTPVIFRLRESLPVVTAVLNLMSAVLLVLPTVTIVRHEFHKALHRQARGPRGGVLQPEVHASSPARDVLPHIFYIVPDSYGGAAVLKNRHGIDNSTFVAWLREQGFQVVADSRANYCETGLSLASSLNMRYLDPARDGFTKDLENRGPLRDLIHHNELVRTLETLG